MGTRSNIGILNEDGTVTTIYCHWDGNPESNGQLLLEHYQTEEKIRQLLKLGDLSHLGPEIGEEIPESYKHNIRLTYGRDDTRCFAYGRDLGETDVDSENHRTMEEARVRMEEYLYIWTAGKWLYSDHGRAFQVLESDKGKT